jgi:hypothetical protein
MAGIVFPYPRDCCVNSHTVIILGKRTAPAFLISLLPFSVEAQKLGCIVFAIELFQGYSMDPDSNISG